MNQLDPQATDTTTDTGSWPTSTNARNWPAFAAAAVPGLPLAAGEQNPVPAPSSGAGFGEVMGTFGHLVWGILGAMPGGHLGGIGLSAAGLGAYVMYAKDLKPKVGPVRKKGPNADGWATKKELRKNLSATAVKRRAATLQPSLAETPWRKVNPLQVSLRLGNDLMHQRELYVSCEDGLLLFAPPRAGKTAFLGGPVIDAPGACVVTTTRGDLHDVTAAMRAKIGPVLVFNGDVAGVANTLRWNPVEGCTDPNVAVRRAGYILAGTATGTDMENGTFWTSNSFRVLRTYLMAAALGGMTLLDVRRWVSRPSDPQPLQILQANAARVPAGWADDLQQAVSAPDRTRDSIYLTLGMSFEFLSLPQVSDIVQPRPGDAPFDPRAFLHAKGTLYLLGEDRPYGSVAPLFSCLTGELFTVAREMAKESDSGRLDPFLRLVLDEAAIICPLPIDRWSSDAGGWGIQILVSVQSLAQLYQRWGRWGGQTIWQNLNKAVLPGLSVLEDQEMVSGMVGEREVQDVSRSETEDGKTNRHISAQRERVITPDKVRTLDPGTAIVFHRSTTPVLVGFQAVWDRADVKAMAKAKKKKKDKAYAKAVKRGLVNTVPAQTAPPMPEYNPTVHTQPIPAQAPAAQNDVWKSA
ncbi:type IV secretory system conjugative DNA transfer family protein [Kitasatospora sp. KL5]|uniref:type IV secretory system conjugative DNA transfer family protein n=1 Tax=Kitasatospora sp. KL5 TaxID=3425125 RepID=UPI003D6F6CE2